MKRWSLWGFILVLATCAAACGDGAADGHVAADVVVRPDGAGDAMAGDVPPNADLPTPPDSWADAATPDTPPPADTPSGPDTPPPADTPSGPDTPPPADMPAPDAPPPADTPPPDAPPPLDVPSPSDLAADTPLPDGTPPNDVPASPDVPVDVPGDTTLPPLGDCHPDIAAAIVACMADMAASPEYDPYTTTSVDLLWLCADAEVVAAAWDRLCAAPDAPAALCDAGYEAFATTHLPICRHELYNRILDQQCVFGARYADLWLHPDAMVVIWQRVLTADSPLTELEREQIVLAVRTTAWGDITTVEEAFAVVDGHIVNQAEVWDASGRRAFTVYEVGAGDNSFGMFFDFGTVIPAARINDGDLYECTVFWGPERRLCADADDCAAGVRCEGRPPEASFGRCVDPTRDTNPAIGSECTGLDGCPAGAGLVCAGARLDNEGHCEPAWMSGRFQTRPAADVPDNDPAGAEVTLLAYGLATVDMDVVIDLYVPHPRPTDLLITLTNPAGTEVPVFDGAAIGPGVQAELRNVPVGGFSGDESVNGQWRLKVVDREAGETGTVAYFALTITSRWD